MFFNMRSWEWGKLRLHKRGNCWKNILSGQEQRALHPLFPGCVCSPPVWPWASYRELLGLPPRNGPHRPQMTPVLRWAPPGWVGSQGQSGLQHDGQQPQGGHQAPPGPPCCTDQRCPAPRSTARLGWPLGAQSRVLYFVGKKMKA